LVVEEAESRACRYLLRADPVQSVWCFTRTEVLSALWRQHRGGDLTLEDLRRAQSRLERLASRWAEVDALIPVRELAERMIRVHPLRVADACQLGAALAVAEGRPRGQWFVSLDDVLNEAAEKEGLAVLRPR
jgi:hypothetical protein